MRKLVVGLLGVVFVLTVFMGLGYAADKFAYIDLTRTFSEYGKTKDFDKALTDKEASYTTERDAKVEEVKKLQIS